MFQRASVQLAMETLRDCFDFHRRWTQIVSSDCRRLSNCASNEAIHRRCRWPRWECKAPRTDSATWSASRILISKAFRKDNCAITGIEFYFFNEMSAPLENQTETEFIRKLSAKHLNKTSLMFNERQTLRSYVS